MATRSTESRRGKKASASSQINASTSELEPPLDHPTTAMPAGTSSLIPFADDPIRCSRLAIPRQHIDALDGREFLNTALIDYLFQRSIQADIIAPYTIVGTSNSLRYFQFMNEKMMSRKPDDVFRPPLPRPLLHHLSVEWAASGSLSPSFELATPVWSLTFVSISSTLSRCVLISFSTLSLISFSSISFSLRATQVRAL